MVKILKDEAQEISNSLYNREVKIKINDTESFIRKAIELNGDEYDYSNVFYKNSSTKVEITCNSCGDKFNQTPNNHISKNHQCANCNGNKKHTRESLIKIFNEMNNFKYDYSKFRTYENSRFQKISILCKMCLTEFEQAIEGHLNHGCSSCSKNKKYSTESLLSKLKLVHNSEYDYDLSNFKNVKSTINVKCQEHGWFGITVRHHLRGFGCSKCNMTSGEKRVFNFLKINKIKNIFQHTFDGCVGIKRKLPFDFYLPDFNICIEYDGRQHFEKVFNDQDFEKTKINDQIKTNFCYNNDIKLIRIPYWDYDNISYIITNKITHDNKIGNY